MGAVLSLQITKLKWILFSFWIDSNEIVTEGSNLAKRSRKRAKLVSNLTTPTKIQKGRPLETASRLKFNNF